MLEGEELSIETDFSSSNDGLLVTFGGIRGGFGLPKFEFANLTSQLDIKKIFIRDLNQTWYHGGLVGIGQSIPCMANYLNSLIKSQHCDRVIAIGNSMGGYAALLFGFLLDANLVLSFSPQTFIDKVNRIISRDSRWSNQIHEVYKIPGLEKDYLDLRKLLSSGTGSTQYHIYYCSRDRLDRHHAKRMEKIKNVSLHEYQEGQHQLVKWLRDNKVLNKIISQAIYSGTIK